jgi:hypothetical protein
MRSCGACSMHAVWLMHGLARCQLGSCSLLYISSHADKTAQPEAAVISACLLSMSACTCDLEML